MQAAIRIQSTTRNLPCCARYVLHVSHITLDTDDMEEWTGRLRVWTYCIQPKSIPTTQTARPTSRTADPLSAPPRNETVFRSGSLMSDSPARRDGMASAANTAVAPSCKTLYDF